MPVLLADYRARHGLTVAAASALVGGSHHVWRTWELGAVPTLPLLLRLADLLGVSRAEIRRLAGPDRVRSAACVGDDGSSQLARWRAAAGLSAAELARRVHVSEALVSRWQSGSRVPGRTYWPRLADVLGVPVESVAAEFGRNPAASDTVPVTGLRDLRARRGLTQAAVGGLIGVDTSTIQRWELTGRAPGRRAMRLATALQVSLDDLAAPSTPRPAPRPVTRLRRMRLRRGLSARVVASRTGVSTSTLLSWERGDAKPTWARARVLARVLRVPVIEVFDAVGLPRPQAMLRLETGFAPAGGALRELRRWQGLGADDLAAAIGVSSSTVLAWEKGRQSPRRRNQRALSEVLRRGNSAAAPAVASAAAWHYVS